MDANAAATLLSDARFAPVLANDHWWGDVTGLRGHPRKARLLLPGKKHSAWHSVR
jgi:hypothetical protein